MTPMIFNALVGLWFFVTTVAWPHTPVELGNTLIVGILAVGVAVSALFTRAARPTGVALGGWMVVSAFLFSSGYGATFWNLVILGGAVGISSLLIKEPGIIRTEREAYGRI